MQVGVHDAPLALEASFSFGACDAHLHALDSQRLGVGHGFDVKVLKVVFHLVAPPEAGLGSLSISLVAFFAALALTAFGRC